MTHIKHRKLQMEREKGILQLISKLPNDCVVVGGYAVNAYAPPRESVDLDTVIKAGNAIAGLLKRGGYSRTYSSGFDKIYGGRIERWEKALPLGPATVDLLIGSLQTRQTGAVWSYDLVHKNSHLALIRCRLGNAKARVPSKELLAAMKMHSARFADARDVGMLCYAGLDVGKIKGFLYRGNLKVLNENIRKLVGYVGDKRYIDGLKSVYGLGGHFDVDTLSNKSREVLQSLLDDMKI
jgi:hypothetical protein